jgi:hypothetical protein
MIQLLMAAALAMLAAARLPVLVRKGRDTVFIAAVLACGASLLTNPGVYTVADRALGGFNLARLIMQALMVLGLWYLRKALLHAVAPEAGSGSVLRRLPLFVALALLVVFFIMIGPTTTTTTWGDDHEKTVVGALFSFSGIAFISWICGEIAMVCWRHLPGMRGVFRPGFSMVAAGCTIGSLTMAYMALDVVSHAVPVLPIHYSHDINGFRILELLSISLVGIGLTTTAVGGQRRRNRIAKWERDALTAVEPIRERALEKAGLERTLESDANAPAQDRLHRLLVEIWDAQLKAGAETPVITREEREYLLSVEEKLDLDHAS